VRVAPPALLALAASAALLAACGSGDRGFSAHEFVEAANREGAGLVLGPPLPSEQQGTSVHSLSFSAVGPAPSGSGGDRHGAGSLYVTPDEESAERQLRACRASASLTCLRAANVVLLFSDVTGGELAAVQRSLDALD